MTLIAESLESDIYRISDYSNNFTEGMPGELRIYVQNDIPDEMIDRFEDATGTKAMQIANSVRVNFNYRDGILNEVPNATQNNIVGIQGWQLFSGYSRILPILVIGGVLFLIGMR